MASTHSAAHWLARYSRRGDSQALNGLRRSDHAFGHGHGLEHFILHAAGHLQRRDRECGFGDVRAHVGDIGGDSHARQAGKPPDERRGLPANERQCGLGHTFANKRPDGAREPAEPFDIGAVVRSANEHKPGLGGLAAISLGSEILEINAVRQGVSSIVRHDGAVEIRFRLRRKQDLASIAGRPLFKLTQARRLQLE